ncbi:MAG TPA: diaminopropionate ammonia-lyase [Pyrinomonadaceae bacterium]|nr:diaminopropionate ammonia-lyase [Pyrinomonadaceae bacterium]
MPSSQYLLNPRARTQTVYPGLFTPDDFQSVNDFFQTRADLLPTPLVHLGALAAKLNQRDILLKDESARFNLNSFKILGVSYAVHRLLSAGRLKHGSTLACATEGNHGRAVAHVAARNDLAAIIYVPESAAPSRIEAIEGEGARVVVVAGNYDEAVRQAALDATRHGWMIVSDTSWHGYTEIPRLIMAGYTRLFAEAEEQWAGNDEPPEVVLVQAGVGGLAGSLASWFYQRFAARRPYLIVCEPSSAACLMESTRAGRAVVVNGPFETMMAGLRCGQISPLAWPALAATADAFVAIGDEWCEAAMRELAHPVNPDPRIAAGASGACGLAALLAVLKDEALRPLRAASGLDVPSRVLVINTEGPTEPELYTRITGRDATAD